MKTIKQFLLENYETVQKVSDIVYNILKREFNYDDENEALINSLGHISALNPDDYTLYYLWDTRFTFHEYVNYTTLRYAIVYNNHDNIQKTFNEKKEIYEDEDITILGDDEVIMIKSDRLEFIIKYK